MVLNGRFSTDINWLALPHEVTNVLRYARIAAQMSIAALLLTACVTAEQAEKDHNAKISEVVLTAAIDSERNRDYETAVRHYQTLYDRDQTNPTSVFNLARTLRYAGSTKQAIALLNGSMQQIGRKPALVLELAKSQLAASNLADAYETLIEAASMKPLQEDWQYHLVWGIYRDRVGDFEAGQASYRKALELSPNNVAVRNNLALSHALAGEIDKGIRILEEIIADETATGLTRQNLALFYGIKGKLEDARQLANKDLPKDLAEKNIEVYREFSE